MFYFYYGGRLKLSYGPVLQVLPGVAGTAVVVSSCLTTTPSGYCFTDLLLVLPVLLRPSQAVRRPGTAVRVSPKGINCAFLNVGGNSFFSPHAKKYSRASRENQIPRFPGFLEGLGTRPSAVAGLRHGPLGMPGVAWPYRPHRWADPVGRPVVGPRDEELSITTVGSGRSACNVDLQK